MAFFDSTVPLVLAHRGGCALGPENTLAAFDRGMAAGADGLELDVRLSSDGEPMVHHDPTLDRTTNVSGRVSEYTVEQLKRVDAAYRCEVKGEFPFRGQGIGVPTLADVLQRYPNARVVVEMKDNLDAMGEAVARVVRVAGAVDRVCAAGFGARATPAARAARGRAGRALSKARGAARPTTGRDAGAKPGSAGCGRKGAFPLPRATRRFAAARGQGPTPEGDARSAAAAQNREKLA
jgi:hypothetical protein